MGNLRDFFSPVKHVMIKEVTEMKRMKIAAFLIVAPILQAIVFGFVAVTDIKNVPTMICDEDNSALSRALTDKFFNMDHFRVVLVTHDPQTIEKQLGSNRARVCLRIPPDFGENIRKGKRAPVQVIGDGTDSNSAVQTMSRVQLVVAAFSGEVFEKKLAAMKSVVGQLPSITMQERVWYNPELKSANVMVPGVIGLILAIVTMVIMSLSIVREKESGNIEQMVVTPITPAQIIAGKIIPYIVIGLIDICVVVVTCGIIFKTPFEGSFLLLLTLSLFMILVNLGIGIYISTISATQQQAMFSAIFFLMPNILLSGFLFPIKNMPEILQWLTYIIPMRYYMVIIRGIFLKGLGFMELLPQTFALFVYGAVVFAMAIKAFRKTVS
ncbi:MAG: ABC transporter permease [Spirochaetia bacterium]|nr:ABC transporter permease [Spirochaetia bacterium]